MKTVFVVGGVIVGGYLVWKYVLPRFGVSTMTPAAAAGAPGGVWYGGSTAPLGGNASYPTGSPTSSSATSMTTQGAANTQPGRLIPLGGLTRINVPTIRSVVGGGAPSAPDPSAPFVATNSPRQQTIPTVPQGTAIAPRPTTLTFGTKTAAGFPKVNPTGGLFS